MARFLYVLLAIALFGVLIAIHEFGHFITAKLLGVKVNEFAIGMGPALWTKQRGETLYALRAFPVGGYCAMEGEDEDTGDPRAFARQAAWKKIIILCAGAFMNFVLGLAITVALFLGVSQARVPVITQFAGGFQHEGADGLMVGDRIVKVDGHGIWLYADVQTYLSRNDGQGVDLVVERDGARVSLKDFPMGRYDYEFEGNRNHGFGLIFGQVEELQNVFYFMALIAVNLAVMNLLPIPALDGGRIFFVLLNGILYAVARKRIPEKYEGYVHAGAFVVLLALMAVVALHDVWNIFA